MTDLRSSADDRPYRADRAPHVSSRMSHDEDTMSTAEYYRSYIDTIRQSRWFPLASVAAAVLIFSGIVSYAYKQGSQSGVNATTPVVEATDLAYKEKPENPGGMDVPFQDAIVFDQLQSQNSAGETIESLLPPPEQPVADALAQSSGATDNANNTDHAAASAAPETKAPIAVTETPESQPTQAVLQQAAPEAAPKEISDIPTVTAAKTDAQPINTKPIQVPQIPAEQQVAKAMDQVAPAAPSPATQAISSGSYRVQLGAFRDEAAARAAWNTFQKQYGSALAGVTPDFPRADLGDRGIFYRVHGKNLSKASADSVCQAINAQRSGSCMVTQ